MTDNAKEKVAKTLAGFANASGGILILGVGEEGNTLCERLEPFGPLEKLEVSFRDFLRDATDPPIPVEVRAVRKDDDSSEHKGVLVFYVAGSRFGPHQVNKTGLFPIRRDASTSIMKGGEVHNMVLGNYWRGRKVEELLEQLFQQFQISNSELRESGTTPVWEFG